MSEANPKRVLIADDHPLYRDALATLLGRAGDLSVGVAVGSLDAAVAAGRREHCDIALIDLGMPGMDGVSGIRAFREALPDIPVAIVSGTTDSAAIRSALAAGAIGYLPKTLEPATVVAALRLMLAGGTYLPPELLAVAAQPADAAIDPGTAGNALTPREQEVLDHIIHGASNKEIARALGVAEVTVKLHMRRILQKLGVRNRAGAVAVALARGLATA